MNNENKVMPPDITVKVIQYDICWINQEYNREAIEDIVKNEYQDTDIIVFPEVVTTGFGDEAYNYYEEVNGKTFCLLKNLSERYGVAIVASYFVKEQSGKVFNRMFFFNPDDGIVTIQDKRHIFRFGRELEYITPGSTRNILNYKGWKIFPVVCYDLRFPVWCRNVNNEYDILLCIANWPDPRRMVWNTLLVARAMENLTYVIGCNRVGEDAHNLKYAGDSMVISPRGEIIGKANPYEESVLTVSLQYKNIEYLRRKFPVWKDADIFHIDYKNIDK